VVTSRAGRCGAVTKLRIWAACPRSSVS